MEMQQVLEMLKVMRGTQQKMDERQEHMDAERKADKDDLMAKLDANK